MTQLHNQYGSGAIFSAGTAGAVVGPSGINDITTRINTHTHDGSDTATLMSYGSGIQSPASYTVEDLATFTNVSGTTVSLNPVGKAFFTSIGGFTSSDSFLITTRIQRSGTAAGIAFSPEVECFSDAIDPSDNIKFPLNITWLDIPTSGTATIDYSLQVKAPSGGNEANIVNSYLNVIQLT